MGLIRPEAALGAIVAALAVAQAMPGTSSSFTDTAASSGTATAAADWTAPEIATVLQKSEGGATGKLHAGETFYVYADATDSGNPASGVGAVSASVGALATTSTATLTSGTWIVDGTTYDRRSALLTAKSTLGSSSYSYAVSASDQAGNGPGTASGAATANNSAFAAAEVGIAGAGTSSLGKPSTGDVITFGYNRAPEPSSALSGWDGSETPVTFSIVDGGVYGVGSANDLVALTADDGSPLPVGYIATGGDFVASYRTVKFTATMRLTGTDIAVTLGTASGSWNLKTDTSRNTPVWVPLTGVIDEFGNAVSSSSVSGAYTRLF